MLNKVFDKIQGCFAFSAVHMNDISEVSPMQSLLFFANVTLTNLLSSLSSLQNKLIGHKYKTIIFY